MTSICFGLKMDRSIFTVSRLVEGRTSRSSFSLKGLYVSDEMFSRIVLSQIRISMVPGVSNMALR